MPQLLVLLKTTTGLYLFYAAANSLRQLALGVRPRDEAVNDMFVRFTVDNDFTIVDADAALD